MGVREGSKGHFHWPQMSAGPALVPFEMRPDVLTHILMWAFKHTPKADLQKALELEESCLFFYHSSPGCQKSLFSSCFHKWKAVKNLKMNSHTWLDVISASWYMCGQTLVCFSFIRVETFSNFKWDFYTSAVCCESDSDEDIFHSWLELPIYQ